MSDLLTDLECAVEGKLYRYNRDAYLTGRLDWGWKSHQLELDSYNLTQNRPENISLGVLDLHFFRSITAKELSSEERKAYKEETKRRHILS